MDWAKTTARREGKHSSWGFGALYIRSLTVFSRKYSHGLRFVILCCCSQSKGFTHIIKDHFTETWTIMYTPIARFMGPTWGPPGDDRTQAGPTLATWTLQSGYATENKSQWTWLHTSDDRNLPREPQSTTKPGEYCLGFTLHTDSIWQSL